MTFKKDTIEPKQKNRINQVIESNKDEDVSPNLIINFNQTDLSSKFNMDRIKKQLHSSQIESVVEAINDLSMCSYIPGCIEQLSIPDIQVIFDLLNIQQQQNLPIELIFNVRKETLKNVYFILRNSKICKSLEIFTQVNFLPIVIHQLPILYVPLILGLVCEYSPNYAQAITHELGFLFQVFEDDFSNRKIETYVVIQVIMLIFRYDAISVEQAEPIIQTINKCCWQGSMFDNNIIKFFLFDFIRNLRKKEYLEILAKTDFFTQSSRHFTNIAVLDRYLDQFSKLLNYYDIDESFLNEQKMVTKFETESLRNFILETNLNLVQSGLIDKFVSQCFPELFNNTCYMIMCNKNDNKDYQENLVKLQFITSIAKFVIPFSQDCRSLLIYSDFHKNLIRLSSFNEKVLILRYLSFFAPFGIEIMTQLAQEFQIVSMCNDILFGSSSEGIIAALDILALATNNLNNENYMNEPLIKEIFALLMDNQIYEILEELSLNSENNEITIKAGILTSFIQNNKTM